MNAVRDFGAGVGDLLVVFRLEMLGEEAGHLHDVRIGVVNDAALGVGHVSSLVGRSLA